MCVDPVTGLMIAATGLQTIDSVQTSMSQQAAAEANEDIARQRARDAIERGVDAEQDQLDRAARLFATQRTAAAANNVAFDGSARQIALDDFQAGAEDAAQLRDNAEREARGFSQQAELSRAEAANTSPFLAGATTLSSGVFDVASSVARNRPVGGAPQSAPRPSRRPERPFAF